MLVDQDAPLARRASRRRARARAPRCCRRAPPSTGPCRPRAACPTSARRAAGRPGSVRCRARRRRAGPGARSRSSAVLSPRDISPSRKPISVSRPSMMVISVPSAAKRQAYSQPITPPPTTASDSGMRSRSRIVSESSTSVSSKGTPGGPAAASCRCAIRNASAASRRAAANRRAAVAARTTISLRTNELGCASDDGHAVAVEVARDLRDLLPGHRVQAPHELAQAGVAIDVQRHAVEVAALEAGHVQRRLAQRLRRQRAGVHAGAADLGRLLDERDLLAEVGRLRRAFLPRRPRADHDQIECSTSSAIARGSQVRSVDASGSARFAGHRSSAALNCVS